MSDAETLREAARLMRENATTTEAMGDPWYDAEALVDETDDYIGAEEAAHIASWHPAVALAVADWLDFEAVRSDAAAGMLTCTADVEMGPPPAIVNGATNAPSSLTYSNLKTEYGYCCPRALVVARAYLGGDA